MTSAASDVAGPTDVVMALVRPPAKSPDNLPVALVPPADGARKGPHGVLGWPSGWILSGSSGGTDDNPSKGLWTHIREATDELDLVIRRDPIDRVP